VAVATGTTTPVISLIGPYTPATYTVHGVLIGETTSSIVATAAGAAGTVLGGNGAADPTFQQKTDPFVFGAAAVLANSGNLGAIIWLTKSETLPTSCTGSQAQIGVLGNTATGATTLTIKSIHAGVATAIGTIDYSGSGATGAFTCASPATIPAGDGLEILGPSTADATLIPSVTLMLNAGAL
jgi:hypothetical protein